MLQRIVTLALLTARGALSAPAAWVWVTLVVATLPIFDSLAVFSIGRGPAARNEILESSLFAAPAVFLILAAARLQRSFPPAARLLLLVRLPSRDELLLAHFLGLTLAALPPLIVLAFATGLSSLGDSEVGASLPWLFLIGLLSLAHCLLLAALLTLLSRLTSGALFATAALALYFAGLLLPVLAGVVGDGNTTASVWLYLLPNFGLFQPALRATAGMPPPELAAVCLYATVAAVALLVAASWVGDRRSSRPSPSDR